MTILSTLVRPKNLVIAGAITALLVFAFYQGANTASNLVAVETFNDAPDYFITKVHVKTFDQQGKLTESLKTEQTRHYEAMSKTLLVSPIVERSSLTGNWLAKAETGIIEDDNKDIILTGNAHATKWHLQSEKIEMFSDSVHYLDRDKSLTSYGNATLISSQGETSAEQIVTYINSENVFMTKSVRGIYETAN